MKRWWAAGLLALACAGGAPAQTILTLRATSDPAICYPVAVGTLFQLMLPASAGTGYSWRLRSGAGFEQVGEMATGAVAGGGMVVGGPQTQVLRFRPTRAGRGRLVVGYARGDGPAVKEASFCLAVREP